MKKYEGILFCIKPMPLFFTDIKLQAEYSGLKRGKKAEENKVYINEIKREREKRIKKEKEREE